jgi:hypothetical protein
MGTATGGKVEDVADHPRRGRGELGDYLRCLWGQPHRLRGTGYRRTPGTSSSETSWLSSEPESANASTAGAAATPSCVLLDFEGPVCCFFVA